jgi:hypothetical protein
MRKGQIHQVYIILFAIIVIGASVYLGVRLIGNLRGAACEANDASFMREVSDALDANAPMGSRNEVRLSTPCNAEALCFVDNGALGSSSFNSQDPTIKKAVLAGVRTTVYLQGKERTVPVGYDERVMVQRAPGTPVPMQPLCVNATGGKFVFRTRGYGRYISIDSVGGSAGERS